MKYPGCLEYLAFNDETGHRKVFDISVICNNKIDSNTKKVNFPGHVYLHFSLLGPNLRIQPVKDKGYYEIEAPYVRKMEIGDSKLDMTLDENLNVAITDGGDPILYAIGHLMLPYINLT